MFPLKHKTNKQIDSTKKSLMCFFPNIATIFLFTLESKILGKIQPPFS